MVDLRANFYISQMTGRSLATQGLGGYSGGWFTQCRVSREANLPGTARMVRVSSGLQTSSCVYYVTIVPNAAGLQSSRREETED